MKKIVTYIAKFCFLIVLLLGCNDTMEPTIPYAKVYLSVNLTTNNEITIPGNSLFFPRKGALRGLGGIILYNDFGTIRAFDAACPLEDSHTCVVVPDGAEVDATSQGGTTGTCSCCGSIFSFSHGFPLKDSKATEGLMQYRLIQTPERITITN